MNLQGKTALVTGAARRIGRAAALALARAGANIVVHYRTSDAEADDLVEELAALDVRAGAIAADLADASAVDALLTEALRLSGRLDILVNSASIFEEALLEEVSLEEFRRNLEINALSPFVLTRNLHRHVTERQATGSVVNLLDSRITDYDRRHVAYALSKRALHSLTQMSAMEFAPALRVNAVAPGLILPPAGKDESYLERLRTTNPLQSHGTLAQVSDAVLFLVDNAFVTGQTIWVDGGRHLKGGFYGYS